MKEEYGGYLKTGHMFVWYLLNMANNRMGGIRFLPDQILFEYPDFARWKDGKEPIKCMAIDAKVPKEFVGLQFRIVPPRAVDQNRMVEVLFGDSDKDVPETITALRFQEELDKAMDDALRKAQEAEQEGNDD